MHTPLAEPRRSIYFDYQVFPAHTASVNAQVQHHPVVIVGAGPIGLTTALDLARYGIPSIVLEAERQVSEGSRAIVFTRRSLEILQQVGISERVTSAGLPWRFGNSYYRNQRVFRMEAPHDPDDRFAPMTNLQQPCLEQFLVDACHANPMIELRWGNQVKALAQADDRATLEVDTPAGEYTLQASWVVAADGARSAIRTLLGLQLEGASRSTWTCPLSVWRTSTRTGTRAIPCSCTANQAVSGASTINWHGAKRPNRPCRLTPCASVSMPSWASSG